MLLESINVGEAEIVSHRNKSLRSGICKHPVNHSVVIETSGIPGDAVIDTRHHGGVDQAIYAYSADDYDWWTQTVGRKVYPGVFGENLTIRGLPTDMNIGDRLLIGEVVLEATAPRIPCGTLAARMQDSSFGIEFREAERPGIYFRVLNSGEVSPGDAVTFIPDNASDVSIVELFRFNYKREHSPAELERLLSVPLATRFRAKVESRDRKSVV